MLRRSNLILVSLVVVVFSVYTDKDFRPTQSWWGNVMMGSMVWVRVRQWEDQKEKA